MTLRCDPEPSCRSIHSEIQKARGRLGQRTRLEQPGKEEKASNGAAEEAVESTRQHPLHAWAVRHGSWILNRFCVARDQQTTPYTGKLVEFGECVMAMCRTAMTNKPVTKVLQSGCTRCGWARPMQVTAIWLSPEEASS